LIRVGLLGQRAANAWESHENIATARCRCFDESPVVSDAPIEQALLKADDYDAVASLRNPVSLRFDDESLRILVCLRSEETLVSARRAGECKKSVSNRKLLQVPENALKGAIPSFRGRGQQPLDILHNERGGRMCRKQSEVFAIEPVSLVAVKGVALKPPHPRSADKRIGLTRWAADEHPRIGLASFPKRHSYSLIDLVRDRRAHLRAPRLEMRRIALDRKCGQQIVGS